MSQGTCKSSIEDLETKLIVSFITFSDKRKEKNNGYIAISIMVNVRIHVLKETVRYP